MSTKNTPNTQIIELIENQQKKVVLDTLDAEIGYILNERKQSGWNLWVIIVGIASIIGYFLKEMETSKTSFENVSLIFLTFLLIYDMIGLIFVAISSDATEHSKGNRFQISSTLYSGGRPTTFFLLLRSLLVIWLVMTTSAHVPNSYIYMTYGYYSAMIVLLLFGFLISFLKYPVQLIGHRKQAKIKMIIVPIIFLWILIPTYKYMSILVQNSSLFSVPDFRVSSIFFALTILFSLLVRNLNRPILLSSLIILRRDLAFGKIDIHSAKRQAEIIFAGMKFTEAFQEELKGIFSSIEKIISEFKAGIDKIDAVMNNSKVKAQDSLIEAVIESCGNNLTNAKNQLNKFEKQFRIFQKRVRGFLVFTEEMETAINDILNKLETELDSLMEISNHFHEKLEQLKHAVREVE